MSILPPPTRDNYLVQQSQGKLWAAIIPRSWIEWFASIFTAISTLPLHNYLHNGRWLIDQEKEGGLYTVNTSNVHCMDGLIGNQTGAGVFKVRRVIDPDNAALMCAEITCTTADTTIGATDFSRVFFRIEGSACSDLRFGTSIAEYVTIKFKYKTNVTGVYGISILNSASNRCYTTTFTALTTNEEETTITIPGDIAGAWLYTDGAVGLILRIALVAGTDFQSSNLNVWQASNIASSASQVNFLSSTSNIFYLKEIRLVKGTSAGGEQIEDAATALRRCQRYYEKSFNQGTAVAQSAGEGELLLAIRAAATLQEGLGRYKVPKATTPTITLYNPAAANAQIRNETAAADCTASGVVALSSNNHFNVYCTGTVGTLIADRLRFHWTADCRL